MFRQLEEEAELVKKTKVRIQDGRNQKSGKSLKPRRKVPRKGSLCGTREGGGGGLWVGKVGMEQGPGFDWAELESLG